MSELAKFSFLNRNQSFLILSFLLISLSGLLYFSCKPSPSRALSENQPSLKSNWMDPWIEMELAPFSSGKITKKKITSTWKECHKAIPDWFCFYQIRDSKVQGPASSMKNFLEAIISQYPIPDLDLIYFNHDILEPSFFKRKKIRNGAPIFVSSKHKSDPAVLFIDWYYNPEDTHSGWNGLIEKIPKAASKISWEDRLEKIFWRGSPVDGRYTWESWTNVPRGRLVYESRYRSPELIDAGFSGYHPIFVENPSQFERELGIASFMPPEEQIHYKYHIDIDGVAATFQALPWKLLSGSLVFKQTSSKIMWFHGAMIPWEHYIPLHYDLRDLHEKIEWAKSHDLEAKKIALNGQKFVLTHLMPEDYLLYGYKTLLKYAALCEN